MHESLRNKTYLGKKLFNFLGANFLTSKSSHWHEKQPVLGPGHFAWQGRNFRHLDVISTPDCMVFLDKTKPKVAFFKDFGYCPKILDYNRFSSEKATFWTLSCAQVHHVPKCMSCRKAINYGDNQEGTLL